MKILYVTSEAAPFCKTGGLADVAGSLPPALAANGDEVAVILPLYGQISDAWKKEMVFRGSMDVSLAWRREYAGLFSLNREGVTWYFVDNE
ncbi:MAG: glycogen/starch synthase, partial [Oscillospiraceae bacterium]|nr:glycogen/starch synthase [Oscillospiraceae bacterium]